jgi:peptidoglycan/LPS O-acetylase OafA/YrhL
MNLIPWIALGLLVFCSAGRIVSTRDLSSTHIRIDELFLGIGLGYFRAYHFERFRMTSRRRLLPLLGLTLLAPWFFGTLNVSGFQSLRLIAASLGFGLIVLWSQSVNLKLSPLASIGKYSYSIYLWHMPIALLWDSIAPMSITGLTGCIVSSLVIGISMARLVEVPMLHLRERVAPSISGQIHNYSPQSSGDTFAVVRTMALGNAKT